MGRNNADFQKALSLWKGDPGELSIGLHRITGTAPKWMAEADDKYTQERTSQAQALLDAVGKAPTNSVTLYRGYRPDEEAKTPLASYTTDRKVAAKFAKKYGGTVKSHKPGTIRAVQTSIGSFDEGEWVGEKPEHPYWSK